MLVRKLDHAGREVWRYPAVVVREDPGAIVVEANFNRDDLDLGFTTFKRGDRFVETFYNDRWYNVFAVYDRDSGALKGWYANICRPATWDAGQIDCQDLALDVWIDPDGRVTLLDEDEFAALPLTGAERSQARQALDRLLALAAAHALPR